MITLIGGLKGGSGKSTLATNIAAYRASKEQDLLLVDANVEQRSSAAWAERREESGLAAITCIEKSGNLFKSLNQLRKRYDHIIVDSGGQDSKEFRTALLAADILITPLRPSQFDNETITYVISLVEQAREINPDLKAYLVFCQAHPNPRVGHLSESRELAGDIEDFTLLDAYTTFASKYIDAVPAGAGVVEMGKSKSANEIVAIINEVYS
ncbi:MAG: chromosome partitioning protein [Cocleimonas sp.]|jgi:chromosome partitioning protein